MPTKSPDLQIEQIPGERYPSRDAAQRAARATLAGDLVSTIRVMLTSGELTQRNGRIEIP